MHFPSLIQDLAVILGVAALVTFIFRRIKQPVVLGYIVAGIIVGPYAPSALAIVDTPSIKVWAELGVIFLMFTLGLEFSFRRLARVGMSAGVTAIVQIVGMSTLGFLIATALGWSHFDAIFLGCMVSISSTTIIIKALDELGLKSKKFSELVFGILIVEDLAAILMLVGLNNIVTTSGFGGVALLLAGGKLAIVVGIWFLVGMVLVPRLVKSVGRHGDDEMLTVVAIGLCLVLVAIAAYFNYSAALGAFIMGSIIAESSEAKRIETLVQPLKDIFGAVFFVSVGMLLDPHTVLSNLGTVLLISSVIILGNAFFVSLGSFLTGQSLRNAIQTGMSMAQIGEFSFIIASLGLTYGVISERLYPIIVAASLITTFTTPYMIRAAGKLADVVEARLPLKIRAYLDNYVAWVQRHTTDSEERKPMAMSITKWCLNAIVVTTLFTLGADKVVPLAERYLEHNFKFAAWLVVFALSSPSIWAMSNAFRVPGQRRGGPLLVSRMLTVGLVGLMSVAYFPAFATLAVTLVACSTVLLIFRRQVEGYYRWIERQFKSGFQADINPKPVDGGSLHHLAPWDAHLIELKVPARSFLVGKPLLDLKLRERYGLNVVVIVRDGENIVAPKPPEPLYPGDRILCFATDAEIERFKDDIKNADEGQEKPKDLESYNILRFKLLPGSRFSGTTIRKSGIRETFDAIVVGLERGGDRILSPSSDLALNENDVLWIVGESHRLEAIKTLSTAKI